MHDNVKKIKTEENYAMKYMFASDIHGSAYYCRKMLDAFEKEGAERLVLLGDLLYHGPRNDLPKEYAPKQVIPMLNSMKDKIYAVRGNCEAEVDQMVLEFPVMAGELLHPCSGWKNLLRHTWTRLQSEQSAASVDRRHSDSRTYSCAKNESRVEGYTLLNPGSVSISKGRKSTYIRRI